MIPISGVNTGAAQLLAAVEKHPPGTLRDQKLEETQGRPLKPLMSRPGKTAGAIRPPLGEKE